MADGWKGFFDWLFDHIRSFLKLCIVAWPGRIALLLAFAGVPALLDTSWDSILRFSLCIAFDKPAAGETLFDMCKGELASSTETVIAGLVCVVLSVVIIVIEQRRNTTSKAPSNVGTSWGNTASPMNHIKRVFQNSEYKVHYEGGAKDVILNHTLVGPDLCYEKDEVAFIKKFVRKINASGDHSLTVSVQGFDISIAT